MAMVFRSQRYRGKVRRAEAESAMLYYILIGVAVLVAAAIIWLYNVLVGRWQMVNNGWADIDVQLKRRSDLVPRLVEIVGGYASHERETLEEVTEKRALTEDAGEDPERRGAAESELSKPVARLIALAEAYPDLKANESFAALQKELVETENQIEMSRRFYNGAVRELNTLVQTFPASLVAGVAGFSTRPYFEIEPVERVLPQVKLAST
ncbi:MAG: LemA family protein [Hyphomonadaceae bacterium]